jgi:hypothetical protein
LSAIVLCIAEIAAISSPSGSYRCLDPYALVLYETLGAGEFRAGNRRFFGRIEKSYTNALFAVFSETIPNNRGHSLKSQALPSLE